MSKNGTKKIPDFECSCANDPCCKVIHETVDYGYVGHTSMRECVYLFNQFDPLWFQNYQVQYEPRRIGEWEIHKFEVSVRDAIKFNIMEIDPARGIQPGNYTNLLWHGADKEEFPVGQTIMSDTPAEIMDHLEFIDRAYGRVLINGLGLGVVANALLREEKRDCIEHIDVVELDPEVIELVSYYFKDDPKITIHQGDAYNFEWPDDAYWHCAWHDIWFTIDIDDLALQNKLHKKYENRVVWQDSWHRQWMLGFEEWRKNREVAKSRGF